MTGVVQSGVFYPDNPAVLGEAAWYSRAWVFGGVALGAALMFFALKVAFR